VSAITRTAICVACMFVSGLFVLGLAGGQDVPGSGKKDKAPKGEKGEKREKAEKKDPEEKAVVNSAEKATKIIETERDKWLKELDKTFAGRFSPGLADADFAQWFALVTGGAAEWVREDSPSKKLRELFDRAAERLNLGKVASLGRGEFLDYARGFLLPDISPPWKPPSDPLSGADKVFRQLDKNESGFLERDEWPERLRPVAARFDRDRDGRIHPDEYRDYFEGRVIDTIEFGPESRPRENPNPSTPPPAESTGPLRYGQLPKGLPQWFVDLDSDRDAQIALPEWRRAGRPLDEFFAIDLNGDGLLPPDEYLRFVRNLRAAESLRELMEPTAEPSR
jgi:hypothetical protein